MPHMNIMERIKQNKLFDSSYDILANIEDGGIMDQYQKDMIKVHLEPYIPPIFLTQKYMKNRVYQCMNTLCFTYKKEDICERMLLGCVMGSLYNEKHKWFADSDDETDC